MVHAEECVSCLYDAVADLGLPKRVDEGWYRWPQALPDGKHFLYFAATHAKAGAGDATGMYVGSTDRREPVLPLHLPVSGLFAGGRFFPFAERR